MPLVAVGLSAYVTGLLAGFGNLALVAIATSVALSVVALHRRSRLIAGLGLALGAGVCVADVAERLDGRCARDLRRAREWHVVLDDEAFPGTAAHASAVGCAVALTIVVRQGRAARGATVRLTGEPLFGHQRLLVRDATIRIEHPPPVLIRWRVRAEHAVDATFGEDAPIARALLVADMRQLAPDVRDRFAASGLAHVLSISGLHVGIIALALEILFGALRLSRGTAAIASL